MPSRARTRRPLSAPPGRLRAPRRAGPNRFQHRAGFPSLSRCNRKRRYRPSRCGVRSRKRRWPARTASGPRHLRGRGRKHGQPHRFPRSARYRRESRRRGVTLRQMRFPCSRALRGQRFRRHRLRARPAPPGRRLPPTPRRRKRQRQPDSGRGGLTRETAPALGLASPTVAGRERACSERPLVRPWAVRSGSRRR